MIARYERLPEWVRWILLIPLSAGSTFVELCLLSLIWQDYFTLINSAAATVTFAWLLHELAPRWKNRFAVASLIFRMIFSVVTVSLVFILGATPDRTTSFEIGRELLGWAAGWLLYFLVFREKRGGEEIMSNSPAEPAAPELGSDISWSELHDTGFPYSSDAEMWQEKSAGNVMLLFDRGLSLQLVFRGFPGSQSKTRLVSALYFLQFLAPIAFALGVILTKHYWYLLALILFIPAWFLSYSYCTTGGTFFKSFLAGGVISAILLLMSLRAWSLFVGAVTLQTTLLVCMMRISILNCPVKSTLVRRLRASLVETGASLFSFAKRRNPLSSQARASCVGLTPGPATRPGESLAVRDHCAKLGTVVARGHGSTRDMRACSR